MCWLFSITFFSWSSIQGYEGWLQQYVFVIFPGRLGWGWLPLLPHILILLEHYLYLLKSHQKPSSIAMTFQGITGWPFTDIGRLCQHPWMPPCLIPLACVDSCPACVSAAYYLALHLQGTGNQLQLSFGFPVPHPACSGTISVFLWGSHQLKAVVLICPQCFLWYKRVSSTTL